LKALEAKAVKKRKADEAKKAELAAQAGKKRARSRSPVAAKRKRAKVLTDEQKWQEAVKASTNHVGDDQCSDCGVWWCKLVVALESDTPCEWFSCDHCQQNWCGFCWEVSDDDECPLSSNII
jgi:hypothetical protein